MLQYVDKDFGNFLNMLISVAIVKNQFLQAMVLGLFARLREDNPEIYSKLACPITDEQTGLYSKFYFQRRLLAREIKSSLKNDTPFCYAIIDIDNFKSVNDEYSHLVGDYVISEVVRILKKNIRQESRRNIDKLGRLNKNKAGRIGGGEEFGVIIAGCHISEGLSVLDRIRKEISETEINMSTEDTIKVTVSGGVTEFMPGKTCLDLQGEADNALYEAKNSGKNKIICYTGAVTPGFPAAVGF